MITNNFLLNTASGNVNWSTDTVYVCLFTSGAMLDVNSGIYNNTNELSTGYGYTRFNKQPTNKTISLDNNQVVYDCDNISWTATGGSIGPARYAAFVTSNSGIINIIDFITDQTATNGSNFNININTSGLFRLYNI